MLGNRGTGGPGDFAGYKLKLNIVASKTFEVEVEEAEPSAEHGQSNPALTAIYSSLLPTAPKPRASSEGDETKVYRSSGRGGRFTCETR